VEVLLRSERRTFKRQPGYPHFQELPRANGPPSTTLPQHSSPPKGAADLTFGASGPSPMTRRGGDPPPNAPPRRIPAPLFSSNTDLSRLSLDAGEGDAFHEVALKRQEHHDDRRRRNEGA